MTEQRDVLSWLATSVKGLNKRSHSDMFAMTNVAAQSRLAQESVRNIRRAQAHADCVLKSTYGEDCYDPPEDDEDEMSTNIVSGNVIVTEDSLQALVASAGGNQPPTTESPAGTGPAPTPPSGGAGAPAKKKPSTLAKFGKLAATGALIAATSAGGAIIANKMMPKQEFTDTANEFDISSPAFNAEQEALR